MKGNLLIISVLSALLLPTAAFSQTKGYEKSIELNAGIPIDINSKYSVGITMINGYRFNENFMIGAGIGYEYFDALYYTSYEYQGKGNSSYYKSYYGKNMLKLFGRIKANLTKTSVSPYFAGDLGYAVDFNANEFATTSGLLFEPQFGIDIAIPDNLRLYIAIGYRGQQNSYDSFDLTYGSTGDEDVKVLAELIDFKFGIKF